MPESESAHPDQVTRNPKTGKLERVFVNLEDVYGGNGVAEEERSFEELRARHRGWMGHDWRSPVSGSSTARIPLLETSGNAKPSLTISREEIVVCQLAEDLRRKALVVDETETEPLALSQQDENSQSAIIGGKEEKGMKQKRLKVREIKQEPKTSKWLPNPLLSST